MQVCSVHTSFAVSRCWEGKRASERNTVAQDVIKQALKHQQLSHSWAIPVPVGTACIAFSSITQPREDLIHYHYQLINGIYKTPAWAGHGHSSNIHKQNNIHIQIGVVENDIELALLILNVLGKGYEILNINGKKWLKFSSATGGNLSNDQRNVYEVCGFMGGYVTRRILRDNFGWDALRCKTVVDEMIMNGLLWVDEQGDREWMYWEPSWISS